MHIILALCRWNLKIKRTARSFLWTSTFLLLSVFWEWIWAAICTWSGAFASLRTCARSFFHCLLCAAKRSTITKWKIVCRCFCSLPAIVNCMVACSFFFQQIGLLCCMEEFVIKVFNFITDQNLQWGLDSCFCFVSCILEEEEEEEEEAARLFSCSSSSSPSLSSSSSSFSSSVLVAVVFLKNVPSWSCWLCSSFGSYLVPAIRALLLVCSNHQVAVSTHS